MARQISSGFGRTGYNPLKGPSRSAPRISRRKLTLSKGHRDVPDGTLLDVTPAPGCTYTRDTWPPRGRGRGESITSPRRIAAKLRAAEVIRLRAQECTWQQIAVALGFADASGAYRAYKRTVDRLDWDEQRRYELWGGDERRRLIEQVRALDDEEEQLTG